MSEKKGFWVRFWMSKERSPKTEETYKHFDEKDGYSEKDEELLKCLVEDWANNDCRGYNSEHYRYGFEIVSKPPKEWLEKELKSLKGKQESLAAKEELIKLELGEMVNPIT